MSRGPDAATQVERALIRMAADNGLALSVDSLQSVRWASATFTGARHRIAVSAERSAALDRWIAGIADAEFPLRRHLVADVAVACSATRGSRGEVKLEVLTVESD